jgi:hypothetical protein
LKFEKKKVEETRQRTQDFIEKKNRISSNLTSNLNIAERNLNLIQVKSKDLDQLMMKSKRAKNVTDEGAVLAEESFQKATQILETLKNFDSIYNLNRKKFNDSFDLIETTKANNDASQKMASTIDNDLRKINQNLNIASRNLQINKLNDINQLNNDSTSFNKKTDLFKDKINQISDHFQSNKKEIEDTTEISIKIDDRISNLFENSTLINKQANDLLAQVTIANEDLNYIENKRSDMALGNISPKAIDSLVQKFNQISKELDDYLIGDADLENKQQVQDKFTENLITLERAVPQYEENVRNLLEVSKLLHARCQKN